MRIFLGVSSVGGIGTYSLSKALNKKGYKADYIKFSDSTYNFLCDKKIIFSRNIILRTIQIRIKFLKYLFLYDVFNFQAGSSILNNRRDLKILKLFRKKIVMTFRGCDLYDRNKSLELYGDQSQCNFCNAQKMQNVCKNKSRERNIRTILKYADKIVIVGPWLYNMFPNRNTEYEVIPYCRDLTKIKFVGIKYKEKKDQIIIVHIPTDSQLKGTFYIKKAIERLSNRGFNVKFIFAKNKKNSEVLKIFRSADIVIDQLHVGWYGGSSVESMALGKPTCCFIRSEYLKIMKEMKNIPIINISIDNIENKLAELINNYEYRKRISILSRKFVEKHHDSEVIAKKYLKVYKSLF